MPATPRVGYSIVDVRDLIDLHIRAMTAPAAAGERFIASGDFLWFADMARVLREGLGTRAAKAPKATIPGVVIRLGALFSPP
jgi:nucleoside-diphosphate-sugar epimerase